MQTLDTLFKRAPLRPRVGVFGCGCWFYWDQFPGLKERLLEHQAVFEQRLAELGAEVVSAGLVDRPQFAAEVGDRFRREDIDLLMCFVSTYALSSTVLPAVQRAGVPLVIISLQPTKAMDYAHGTTFMQLEHDNQTSLPELCYALNRAGLPPAGMVVGTLYDDARAWERITGWVKVARAYATVRKARIGVMGHTYEGMLDMNADPTLFDATFGLHCEHIELDDLHQCVSEVQPGEVSAKLDQINALFDFPEPGADPIAGPAKPEDLAWTATVACGLDRLVEQFTLTGLAYYYRGLSNANEKLGSSFMVGASLLTGRGVPIAGELDIRNCLAMLVLDRLEAGGSFCEIHPCDFDGDIVLVGHDGPHHIAVAQGKPVLRGLTILHGKRGHGVSVEFQIKNGPVTCAGLTQDSGGRFKFILAEGESLPGPIPPTGNTNTRCRFPPDVASFIENWSLAAPTHHFALGIGHVAGLVQDLARCYNLQCVNVTEPGYHRP
ncbi:MAG: L-fucose/L-arabinose isomerase family protein [Chloroflexi bacterium]|nr:L-fucose/L-arabinose isomerase family protein [Chloroflexota bacterium]